MTNTPYLQIKAAQAYRVIYQVKDVEQKVVIIRVAKRTESTYKGFP